MYRARFLCAQTLTRRVQHCSALFKFVRCCCRCSGDAHEAGCFRHAVISESRSPAPTEANNTIPPYQSRKATFCLATPTPLSSSASPLEASYVVTRFRERSPTTARASSILHESRRHEPCKYNTAPGYGAREGKQRRIEALDEHGNARRSCCGSHKAGAHWPFLNLVTI